MLSAKLTKIESTHKRLRTNEIVGKTPGIPEVGENFMIFGESLTKGAAFRQVTTTQIQSCAWFPETKKFVFKTLNSTYELEILSEKTEAEIMEYGKWKKAQ